MLYFYYFFLVVWISTCERLIFVLNLYSLYWATVINGIHVYFLKRYTTSCAHNDPIKVIMIWSNVMGSCGTLVLILRRS